MSLFRLVFFCLGIFTPSLLAGVPSRFHDFGQVGDGQGAIRTVFWISNQNATEVRFQLKLFKDDGSPLALTIEGTTASSFEFTVAPGGVKKLVTSGNSAKIEVGWAQLVASENVGAQVLFEIFADGKLATQAAVESPGPVQVADLFVERRQGTDTGVALANLSEDGPVRVRLKLKDETGKVQAEQDLELKAFGHVAKFLGEIFSGVGSDFRGSLEISATGPITVITLQQTGLVLGTLPPLIRTL